MKYSPWAFLFLILLLRMESSLFKEAKWISQMEVWNSLSFLFTNELYRKEGPSLPSLHVKLESILKLACVRDLCHKSRYNRHLLDRSSYWRCSIKKMFLKALLNWQENTCAKDSFLIKLQVCKFIKKKPWHRCFTVNFEKSLRTPFLRNTSGWLLLIGLIGPD